MSTKTCQKCSVIKQIDDFGERKICKSCYAEECREKYKKKQESLLLEIEEKGADNVTIKCSKCKEPKKASQFNKTFRNCKDCNTKNNKKIHADKMKKQKEEGYSFDFEKKCPKCNIVKKGTEFSKNTAYCKPCMKPIQQKEYESNRTERIQKNREYRKKRVEAGIEFATQNNKRTCKQCLKELDCSAFSICGGNFLQTVCNPCRVSNNKEYRHNNPEIIKAYTEKNKIKNNSRARVRFLVTDTSKRITRDEMFGCSVTQFQEWLQFCCTKLEYDYSKCGSQWEIDHVIPCKLFEVEEKKEEQIACFHWTNMVPLESHLNSSKSDKIIMEQVDTIRNFLDEFIELKQLNADDELRYWKNEYKNKIDNYPKYKIRKTFRLVSKIKMNVVINEISGSGLVTDC